MALAKRDIQIREQLAEQPELLSGGPQEPDATQRLSARVNTVHHDYVTANIVLPDETLASETVNVAKPVPCRRSEFKDRTDKDPTSTATVTYEYTGTQARTVTRSEAGNDTTEDQVIIPWYVVPQGGETGSLLELAPAGFEVEDDAGTGKVFCEYEDYNSGRIYMAV